MTVPRQAHASGGMAGYSLATTTLTGGAAANVLLPAFAIVNSAGDEMGSAATPLNTSTVAKGGSSMATGQIAVTTAATLVAAARTGRQKITLSPTTSTAFYVGNTGVTTATGLFVAAGGSVTLDTGAAVYAVGAAGFTMSYVELY